MNRIAPPPPPVVNRAPPPPVEVKTYRTMDAEVYLNYALFMFTRRNYETGEPIGVPTTYELYNELYYVDGAPCSKEETMRLMETREFNPGDPIATFNGMKYDLLLITAFFNGADNSSLKRISAEIIDTRMMPWDFEKKYGVRLLDFNHIDLIEVAFGAGSLKVYGARLKSRLLQELPIHFDTFIMDHQRGVLTKYCHNDNIVTSDLFKDCKLAIELRESLGAEYGVDFRSKSDAQIGEAIIVSETKRMTGITLRKLSMKTFKRDFYFVPPPFIEFESEQMNGVLAICTETLFNVSDKTNKVTLPPVISKQIKLGDGPNMVAYKMGIGGLHSVTSGGTFYSDDDYDVFEIDVSSFYPNIIILSKFFVPQIGMDAFLEIYQSIVNKKNDASARMKELFKIIEVSGETEEIKAEIKQLLTTIAGVKIAINGAYGKLSNHHSKIFAPSMLVHTTLTGQLGLFMLLEQLHKTGIHVLSANTDGINVRVHKSQRKYVDDLVEWWCNKTGFVMDYNHYQQISYRDVNNYFYKHQSGKIKGIGIFAGDGIRKSPANSIVRDAIFAFVDKGTPIHQTIEECTDPFAFLTLKKVTGGAFKGDELLGGTVRWYRSNATDTAIHYVKPNKSGTHNQVAGSENGMPLMNVTPGVVPEDVDRDWYVNQAYQTMAQIGMFDNPAVCKSVTDDFGVSKADFFDIIGVNKAMIKKYKINI